MSVVPVGVISSKKLVSCFLFTALLISALSSYSQAIRKCGYSYVHNEVAAVFPSIPTQQAQQTALKLTAGNDPVVVPVVFHIVLTDAQLKQLGEALIPRYLDSQVAIITRDFSAQNKDSVAIPAAFKPLYGNAGISFALAHTAPDGSATAGYDIRKTIQSGFNLGANNYGSKLAFSDAKYNASGGLDAWDPTTYLNIWIIEPIDNNTKTNLLGLTIPPSFIYSNGFPSAELGIVLNYEPWVGSLANFKGRTLTHELGHYFELRHIWGDDNGKCPDSDGEDDGISDTPPQSYETYGCPAFPKFDGCTRSGSGIMFMNYMDYTNDACQHLFTKEQAARMRLEVAPFARSYGLTQHPEVLKSPSGAKNAFTVYPNPGDGRISIRFNHTSNGVKGIVITNTTGQVIARREVDTQQGFYSFDLSQAGSGMYFVRLDMESGKVVQKIIVR